MRMVMVCVRDAKSELYAKPIFVTKVGEAERSFRDAVMDPERGGEIAKHPEDYALYEIGLFDDNEGKIYPYDIPRLVIQGSQVANYALQKNITAV